MSAGVDLVTIMFGLGVGILVGMTGIGGGSIMTPLLILVLGVKPVTAIGTDLAYAAVTKTLGGWRHWRHGNVDLAICAWLGVGSIPGAIAGVWLLEGLHRRLGAAFDDAVLTLVAVALAITGLATLGRAVIARDAAGRERETLTLQPRDKLSAVLIGLVVGLVLGVSSAGSGALIAVGLIMVFRLVPRRVVGTDVFHAAILLWVAAAGHLIAGNVDLGLAATLLIGSLPGVWLGSELSVHVPPAILRPALGIVLCTASMGLLIKAGTDVPTPVFAGVPILLAIVARALHTRPHRDAAGRKPLPSEPLPGADR